MTERSEKKKKLSQMPVLLTRRRRGSKIFGGAILIAVARVYVIQREALERSRRIAQSQRLARQ